MEAADGGDKASLRTWFADIRTVCNIAVPTAIGNGLEYLPVLFGIALVGHEATAQADLDALALARTFFNVVAAAPGFGIITALRTLCPQAVGAGQPRLCALYLQRAFFFILLWSIVVVVCSLYADTLLILIGQPEAASRHAQPYVLRMLPTYFGVVGMSAIQRVYQAHHENYANLAIVTSVFCCAPPLQWLLIKYLNWGVLGAAWASSIYNQIYFFLQVPHLCCTGRGYLFVPRTATLSRRGLHEYLRLMVPGFLMCCIEWWVLEALVFLAGRLQHAEVTIASFVITGQVCHPPSRHQPRKHNVESNTLIAMWPYAPHAQRSLSTLVTAPCAERPCRRTPRDVIDAQVQSMGLMAWIGLAVAASSLVGTRIGAGDLIGAKRAALLTPLVGAALAAAVSAGVAIGGSEIASALAHDPAIDAMTARLLPLVAVVMVLDALSNSMGGVCSGLGLQRYAMLANVLGYYLLGIPMALAIAFLWLRGSEDGVYGLWGGVALAMLASGIVQCVLIARHDWRTSAAEARRRLSIDGADAEGASAVLASGPLATSSRDEPGRVAGDAGLTNSERAQRPLLSS